MVMWILELVHLPQPQSKDVFGMTVLAPGNLLKKCQWHHYLHGNLWKVLVTGTIWHQLPAFTASVPGGWVVPCSAGIGRPASGNTSQQRNLLGRHGGRLQDLFLLDFGWRTAPRNESCRQWNHCTAACFFGICSNSRLFFVKDINQSLQPLGQEAVFCHGPEAYSLTWSGHDLQ